MALAAGILGGTTTMLARNATRKMMQRRARPMTSGAQSVGSMLLWAAAAGVILALADVVLERRRSSSRGYV